jgi:hypothetical protein
MNPPQLSDFLDFDVKNIIFSKPEVGSVAGGASGVSKISFKRVRIGVKYPDGSTGDLLMRTPENLMSFGLQENTDLATGAVSGYQFPICLWNRNGPTTEEKKFTDKFDEILEYCKRYLVDHRDEIEKYDLEMNDLKKFNPIYRKMEKGKIVEGRGPMLYLKVMSSKKTGQIMTGIIDDETNTYIEPMEVMNKRCHMTGAIKFESVFVGNKISLQIKLYETVIRIIDNSSGARGLLRPNARPKERQQQQEDNLGGGGSSTPLESKRSEDFFETSGETGEGEGYTEDIYEEVEEEEDSGEGQDGGETEEIVTSPPIVVKEVAPSNDKTKVGKVPRGRTPKSVVA